MFRSAVKGIELTGVPTSETGYVCLVFKMSVWLFQEVDEHKIFLSIVKQKWNGRLHESSRANLNNCLSNFMFLLYLDVVNISK